MCISEEICAVANAARHNLIRTRKFTSDLIKRRAGALVIVFQICYHHAEPRKCLRITCYSTYLLKDFWPNVRLFVKLNEVAQFNAKFRLTLNWTLLRLFDFMIVSQIIVRFMMDLANTCVFNMIIIKNKA